MITTYCPTSQVGGNKQVMVGWVRFGPDLALLIHDSTVPSPHFNARALQPWKFCPAGAAAGMAPGAGKVRGVDSPVEPALLHCCCTGAALEEASHSAGQLFR